MILDFSSDEINGGDVKEGNNLVPPGGCGTSQDVESNPSSASANDSTSLPSGESAPTTPQSSSSPLVPADGADPLARRMGKYSLLYSIFVISCVIYLL
jgi:hypothetical protein